MELFIGFVINSTFALISMRESVKDIVIYSWSSSILLGRLWQWDGIVYSTIESDFDWNLHELDQVTFKWTEFKYGVSCCRRLKDVLGEIIKVDGEEQGQRCDLIKHKFPVFGIVKGDE